MKKELQTNIRTVKNTLSRLLQRAEKIHDVAERNLVRSHLKKAHDELSEAHEKLQSDASCRDCSAPVRRTDNDGGGSVSCGVSQYEPGIGADELIRRADALMYLHKPKKLETPNALHTAEPEPNG